MADEPDYKAELAEAVRIAREDRMYARLHQLGTGKPPEGEPPKPPEEGGPPPPKPEPETPPKTIKSKGYWADALDDPPEPPKE